MKLRPTRLHLLHGHALWLGIQGESYSLLQTELRRRFPDKIIVVSTIAADWGASYLPPPASIATPASTKKPSPSSLREVWSS